MLSKRQKGNVQFRMSQKIRFHPCNWQKVDRTGTTKIVAESEEEKYGRSPEGWNRSSQKEPEIG